MNNLVEAALLYAEKGYHVFPCRPKTKKPATPNGFKDATTDQQTIRGWWEKNPNYNVAIATGRPSRLWVLDVDGEEGRESYLKYQGDIPYNTPQVKTPSGGLHLYFAHDENAEAVRNSVKSLPGLDVRTTGGYVLAPESTLDNGRYEYQSKEWRVPTTAPESLLKALQQPAKTLATTPVEAAIVEGTRNSTLFSRARSLFKQGYSAEEVFALLETLNRSRCLPPLESSELVEITASASKYERGELRIDEQVSSSLSPKSNDSDDTVPKIRRFKNMRPPTGPRPYIVDGVLFKGFAGAIYGDGGSAKSLLMMHLSQCVARGNDWLGFKTTKTNVLYLDFELDEDEQSRRAYQIASGKGYDTPPEGFFYISGAGYKSREVFALALESCKENGIGMVVVDSLGFALNGDAEASRDVLAFFREVEGSFRRQRISLLNVDHQSKGGSYQDKTIFGSVYKSNAVRSVFQVEPGERGEGYINLTLRHKKVNFGPLLEPFGTTVQFIGDKEVRFESRELDAGELAGETTLNALDRVRNALQDCGAMYPEDISKMTGLELGTVKNKLTTLRKRGEVANTGNKNKDGAFEVSLSSTDTRDDDDDDTYLDSQRAA